MNKKLILISTIIVIITITVIAVNVSMGRVIIIGEKYYSSPKTAVYQDMSPTENIEIKNEIDLVAMTDKVTLYLSETANNELLLAELYTKDGKYFFSGTHSVYYNDSVGNYISPTEIAFTETRYKNDLPKIKYAVVFENPEQIGKYSNVISYKNNQQFKDFWLVYEIF